MERALRVEEDDGAIWARLIGAAVAEESIASAHLCAHHTRRIKCLRTFGERWEERLVEVGAHPVAECGEEGEAVTQDVATCGELITDPNEELLLAPAAIKVIGPRRLAHARIGEGAVAIKVPVPLWQCHATEVASTVRRIKDGSLDVHINTTNVVNQLTEGWNDDDSSRVDRDAEHGAERLSQCNCWTLWEERLVALRRWPERVDLWLPDISVSHRDVDDVAWDGDGAHPATDAIPAGDDHRICIERGALPHGVSANEEDGESVTERRWCWRWAA